MVKTTDQATKLAKSIIGFILIDIVACVVYMIVFKTSLNRIYSSIMFSQMLVLLLLFETNLPSDIIIILRELSYSLLAFGFIIPDALNYSYPGCSPYDRKLNLCSTMKLMRIEARGAINNLIAPLFIFIFMGSIHSVVSLIYYKIRKAQVDVIHFV